MGNIFKASYNKYIASLVAQRVRHLSAMWETQVQSLGGEDPLERKWQPTPVFLPGESHGWRSLVDYSLQGQKELDTTERFHFHNKYIFAFSSTGSLIPLLTYHS